MPDLFALRYDGTVRGPDIIDPLLTVLAACTARGRNELDANATPFQEVQLVVQFIVGLRVGQQLEVIDADTGLPWYGKLIGVSHDVTSTEVVSTLKILKPALP